ncbi:MAG TPA: hypothetical protein VIK96_02790 [Bacilli bacterium]
MRKDPIAPKYYVFDEKAGRGGKLVEVASEGEFYSASPIEQSKYPFLSTNPFLYNPENAQIIVYSIEDFLIKVGKQDALFGDAIRNPVIPISKRKRIIKKTFKTWKKNYIKEKKLTFTEGGKIVDVLGEVSVLKFSWKYRLLLFLLFGLTVLLVGIDSYLWEEFALTGIGNYFYNLLAGMYEGSSWLRSVGNFSIYVILFSIFYASIYTLISDDFLKNYKLTESFLDNSEKNIDRSFKKRWRTARKYYLRALKNIRKVPPLGIEEVQEGQVNIDVFKQVCQVLVDRAYKYKKAKPVINVLKFLLLALSVLGSGTVLLFTIFQMILSIFR